MIKGESCALRKIAGAIFRKARYVERQGTRPKGEEGFILVGVIALSIALIILVTAMTVWVRNEAHISAKQGQSTTAFHLAEAAVDRGRWKLQETDAYWTIPSTGGVITGYNFDTVYTDVPGGQYTIYISSDPENSKRRVVKGIGRDTNGRQTRFVRVIFERASLDSAIMSGGSVDVGGNSVVNWGPVKSQSNIVYGNNPPRYPRLYARGYITDDPPYCGSSACAAKTDNVQYWAYYDVPARPTIQTEVMLASAIANGTRFTTDQNWNNAYPGGSCTGCPAGVEAKLDDNLIWYFDEDLSLGTSFITGTLIIMGTLTMTGSGNGEAVVTPPSDAKYEYKYFDTSAANEWYGDAGGGPPSSVSNSFSFVTSGATPALSAGIKEGISIRGFIYAKLEYGCSGSPLILGMIVVDRDEVANSGSTRVFYSTEATANVTVGVATLSQVEWKELPGTWPNGL